MKKSFENPVEKETNDQNCSNPSKFPDPGENLLWKLTLKRRKAFEEMNKDVDDLVNQCLKAKRHLQAVSDSNMNLKKEVRSLRIKYEALLEKNKNDTGIIMKLKDSEGILRKVVKSKFETYNSLQELKVKNKEKTLERELLQDDREKLLFKSQTVANLLRKVNLKHEKIYESILKENRMFEENERCFLEETEELRSTLYENDGLSEKWLKDTAERDNIIRRLRDDLRDGLMIHVTDDSEDGTNEEKTTTNDSSDEEKKGSEDKAENTADTESELTVEKAPLPNKEELAFQREWIRKKTLYEAAERLKEHWMDFYMILNRREQNLNIEIVNVREWLLDKEAERREFMERVKSLEEIVSQKRRRRPVPPRASIDEMEIWIQVQRQTNDTLRKIVYTCLDIRKTNCGLYAEFIGQIRQMYLDALKEQSLLGQETEKGPSEENKVAEGQDDAKAPLNINK